MGLLDDIQAAGRKGGKPCTIHCDVQSALPAKEWKELLSVLDDPSVSASQIARALRNPKRNINVSDGAIQRFRREGCSCGNT